MSQFDVLKNTHKSHTNMYQCIWFSLWYLSGYHICHKECGDMIIFKCVKRKFIKCEANMPINDQSAKYWLMCLAILRQVGRDSNHMRLSRL